MTGCKGNGINFPYGGNFNNFNLYELNNCYMINMLNVGKMGLMQHTTFYTTGGFSANTLTGLTSTYQPYYSQMIDCACMTGSSFSTTVSNTLYVDNATWIKSNGSITTGGSLTLNIDYGFPNKSTITTPVASQVLSYDGSKWINSTPTSGVTTLSGLSDISNGTLINDNVLIYTTNAGLNKWTNYSISGATFNDTTKTITISSGSSSLASLTDATITTPSTNQLLQYNGTKWINYTPTYISSSSLSSSTDATITSPSTNQLLQYNGTKWINYTPTYISSSSIASSTDATITTPSNNQLLQYNSASGKWINATVSTGAVAVFG